MWLLSEIAEHINGVIQGDEHFPIRSIATLQSAGPEQISFLSNKKYKKYLTETGAGAVILSSDLATLSPCNVIVVDDPYVAYAKAANLLQPEKKKQRGIHPSAVVGGNSNIHPNTSIAAHVVIGSGVNIAEGTVIGPGCVLGDDVVIKKSTTLIANITICDRVRIGQRVLIHPGAVVGADGFGIANNKGVWIKVPQIGSVQIGDDVDIGANTTIDCGAIEDTIIENGVKLDNQIQIAHNVIIGENTVIAGCTGVAGSSKVGRNCVIGGGVAISGHLSICDGVQITGMSMVTKSITKAGTFSSGIPAEPTHQWHRNVIRYRQMDKLAERVKQLEKE